MTDNDTGCAECAQLRKRIDELEAKYGAECSLRAAAVAEARTLREVDLPNERSRTRAALRMVDVSKGGQAHG